MVCRVAKQFLMIGVLQVACMVLFAEAGVAPAGTCSGGCNWDQYCHATTKVCTQLGERGKACTVTQMCVAGLGCLSNMCENLKVKGESCAVIPCASRYFCDNLNSGTGFKTCKDRHTISIGKKCATASTQWCKNTRNAYGGDCIAGVCVAKAKIGAACPLGFQQCRTDSGAGSGYGLGIVCEAPSSGAAKVCGTLKNAGEACLSDRECGYTPGKMGCIQEVCAPQSSVDGKCGRTKPANVDVQWHCKASRCANLKCHAIPASAPGVPAPTCVAVALGGVCTRELCECHHLKTKTFANSLTDVFCKGAFNERTGSSPGTCSMPLAIGERGCRRTGSGYDYPLKVASRKGSGYTSLPSLNVRCKQEPAAVCLDENTKDGYTSSAGLCVKVKSYGEACEAPPGYAAASEYAHDEGYHEQCNHGYCQDGICTKARTMNATCDKSYQCGYDSRAWSWNPETKTTDWGSSQMLCRACSSGSSVWTTGQCAPACEGSSKGYTKDWRLSCPKGWYCHSKAENPPMVPPGLGFLNTCKPENRGAMGAGCSLHLSTQAAPIMFAGTCATSPGKVAVCIPGPYNWSGKATRSLDGQTCTYGTEMLPNYKTYSTQSRWRSDVKLSPGLGVSKSGLCMSGPCTPTSSLCCGGKASRDRMWKDTPGSAFNTGSSQYGNTAVSVKLPTSKSVKCKDLVPAGATDGGNVCCKEHRCFKGVCPNAKPEASTAQPQLYAEDAPLRCILEKKPGEACTGFASSYLWHSQCPTGHCDQDGKCTDQTTCTKDYQCGRVRVCNGATATSSGICKTRCGFTLRQGGYPYFEKKFSASVCAETEFCEDHSCMLRNAIGQTCTSKTSCVKGAECVGATCVEKKSFSVRRCRGERIESFCDWRMCQLLPFCSWRLGPYWVKEW